MRTVKGQYATVVVGLCELFATPPVSRLTYKELAKLLGAGPEAVKTWARRGIPPKAHLRVLQLAGERGASTLERAKNLLEGGIKGLGAPRTHDLPQGPIGTPTKEGPQLALIDMKSATEKICHALKEDLERSRALVLLDTTACAAEHARHQELVWSLKDLARRLHRMGFDMRNLFDVTDELAREVGLPARQPDPKPPA